MSFTRNEIAKNVFVGTEVTDSFKSGLIRVTFSVPLKKETATANALVPYILKRGTERFPDLGAIRCELESLYDSGVWGGVSKRGDIQNISVNAGLLDNRFSIDGTDIVSGVLNVMEQILFHPVLENGAFKEEYVKSEREKMADSIRSDANNKIAYSARRCEEEMFAGEDYAVCEKGDITELETIGAARVYEAYKTLLSKARIEILAVGHFDPDMIQSRFAAMFASVGRAETAVLKTEIMREPKREARSVYEHQNIGQGKLTMGFYTGVGRRDPDFLAMQQAIIIFGGSTSSKLFMNVRERLSLCYYCSASYNSQKGSMLVRSGIEFAKKKAAVDEIMRQLSLVQQGDISEDELRDAKNTLKNSLRAVTDRTGSIADWQYECVMNGVSETPEERMAKIDAVTKEEIAAAAGKIRLDTVYFLCGMEVSEDD